MGEEEDNAQLDKKMVVADLPAELSSIKLDHITLRLLLQSGSVKLRSDGTLTWPGEQNKDLLSSIDTEVGYIKDDTSAALVYRRALYGLLNTTHIHNETYRVEQVAITLAGGAGANDQILGGTVGDKNNILWMMLSWDTAPAAAYIVDLHDNGAAATWRGVWEPTSAGQYKAWAYWDSATANTATEVDITGGAGAEVIYVTFCYCVWD